MTMPDTLTAPIQYPPEESDFSEEWKGDLPKRPAPVDVEALVERARLAAEVAANGAFLRELASALLRIAEENRRLREALRVAAPWVVLESDFAKIRAALGDTPAGLDRQGPLSDAG